jgi:putative sterol carrier protein
VADTISGFFKELGEQGYNPLLGHMQGKVRFDLTSGNGGGVDRWLVAVDHGAVTVSDQMSEADCTIGTERPLFERLINGEENAMAAVLRGDMRCTGDVQMLLMIQRIFPGPPPERAAVPLQGVSQ